MNSTVYEKAADQSNYLYFVDFNDMAKGNYKFFDRHIHRAIEVVVCYDGLMAFEVNSLKGTLTKGDVLITNPLDAHYYEYIGNASCYIMVISQDLLNDLMEDPKVEFENKIKLDELHWKELLNVVEYNKDKIPYMNDVQKKAFVLSVFGDLIQGKLYRKKETSNQKHIASQLLLYVEENYKDDITLEVAAKHFGYTKNYFCSLFFKTIGVNYIAYLNNFRLNKVFEYKKAHPDERVSSEVIALNCGFNSAETFYRTVRHYKGSQRDK